MLQYGLTKNKKNYLIQLFKMQKSNRAISILAILFIILTSFDLYSTLIFKDLIVYLEANPIYQYIGIPGIIAINILFIIGIYYWYKKSTSVKSRFYVIHLLTVMNAVRMFVIWNNFNVYKHFSAIPTEQAIEIAKTVTQEMKMQQIAQIAGLQLLPIFIGLITFWLFHLDHNIVIKERRVKNE
jgi:riboflavin transporter FmnP